MYFNRHLEIRDDISDSQSITSKIKEDLNNPSFDYSESPLLYAVKAHIHFKLISDSLDKVRTSIIIPNFQFTFLLSFSFDLKIIRHNLTFFIINVRLWAEESNLKLSWFSP